jgi:hypothetical protein
MTGKDIVLDSQMYIGYLGALYLAFGGIGNLANPHSRWSQLAASETERFQIRQSFVFKIRLISRAAASEKRL